MLQTDALSTNVFRFQEEQGRRLSLIGNCSMSELTLLTRFLARLVILEPDAYKFYQKNLAIFTLGIQRELPYNSIKNCDFAESVNKHYLYGWPHDIVFFEKQATIDIALMAKIFSLNKGRDFLIINSRKDNIPKYLTRKVTITELQEAKDHSSQIIRVANHTEESDKEINGNG